MPPLRFETPPPAPAKGPLDLDDVTELIANTGQWARTGEGRQQNLVNRARRIRDGKGTCAGHRWETSVRPVDGTYALYVRHIAPLEN